MSADNIQVKDEFYAEMLPDFLDEANENLERLNEHLLEFDEQVLTADGDAGAGFDAAVLNEMFRAAHTLKGLSGMLGLPNINSLTHKVENIFDAARNSELNISADVVEVVFEALDRLAEMVGRLKDGHDDAVDCASVHNYIDKLLQKSGVERPMTSQQDAEQAMRAAAGAAEETSQEPGVETAADELATPSEDNTPADAVAEDACSVSQQSNEQTTTPVEESGEAEEESANAADAGGDSSKPLPPQAVEPDIFAEIEDDVDLTSKYISIFVDEAELTLDQVIEILLAESDENVTEKVLVLCHRMKGSAATVGLRRAAKLAHFMEDLLQILQDKHAERTVEMTDAMLDCAEALRIFVAGLKHGQLQTQHFGAVHQKLIRSQAPNFDTPSSAGPTVQTTPATAAEIEPVASSSDVAEPAATAPAETSVASPEKPLELTAEVIAQVSAGAPAGVSCFIGLIAFRDDVPAIGMKADLLYGKLTKIGDVFYCQPPKNNLDDVENSRTIIFGLASEESAESIQAKLLVHGVSHVELRPLLATASSESRTPNRTDSSADSSTSQPADDESAAPGEGVVSSDAAAASRSPDKAEISVKPTETVRVDIDRLDQLMNLSGQLVINKARFTQVCGGLRNVTSGKQSYHSVTNILGSLKRLDYELDSCQQGRNTSTTFEDIRAQTRRIQTEMEAVQRRMTQFDTIRHSVNELLEAVHQLDRVSHGIQKCVMDTRMVPIGPLFARFKRVVRDISRGKGKEINLEIRGEKTELDKRMIDELGDPLIHIVRNSADHGIEVPDDRVAAGKPRQGTVILDASHRGNSIVIQVTDDGKGLDVNKIRDKAVKKGLLSPTDAEKLTDHQVYQLIWEPGLSTAEKVTEVSGRGMGMDIVRTKIEEINGSVELDSEPGRGTTITIKLPLTLAILPSLLAEIDGDIFAMPVESVSEIVRVAINDLSQVHGLTTATIRGRVISVVQLSQLFDWHNGQQQSTADLTRDDPTLVILSCDGREIGLVVDRLLGEEDLVIKSLAENFRNVEGIAGASILGDGRVSLIFDVVALVERAATAITPACSV